VVDRFGEETVEEGGLAGVVETASIVLEFGGDE